MRIGVDIRALVAGRSSGVEAYTKQFLQELFALCPDDEFILFFNAYSETPIDLTWTESFENVTIKRTRIPNKILNFSLWYAQWPKLDKLIGGVDVFFMPNINFCAVSKNVRLIVTMHDLSFVHYPQMFSRKRRAWHFFVNPRALAVRADQIVAVSEATRSDIIATYAISPRKITMIWSAVDARFHVCSRNDIALIEAKEQYALPYRFILSLSTIEPRKNIDGLVYAYNALRKHYGDMYKDVALVIAGNDGWKNRSIYATIANSPYAKDIHILGFVAEEDKVRLYNLASVFVYPSFFEGFGFPPLEAMACGTPTIVSNTSSLPEIIADGAVMIDPDRPEEMMYAMHSILSDRAFAGALCERAHKRVATFSWKKTAESFRVLLQRC